MKKIIAALVAASVIATASLGMTTTAEAHGPGPGFGIAAGIIGGLAVGSIIASQNRPVVVYDDDAAYCHRVRFVDEYGYYHVRRVCR